MVALLRVTAWQAVLFDLDGTLIDSAGDLGRAVNLMLAARGRPTLPLHEYRPHGGSGARGMLGRAFGASPGEPAYDDLKREFLDRYETLMFDTTAVFAGVEDQLAALDAMALPWGIVTNKAERFATPLVRRLGLRCGVLVGGDTTPHAKPHPAPLLEAARRLGVDPARCLYVGDDERDMIAGRAAGMSTAVAAWGYLGVGADPSAWGADFCLNAPGELLNRLGVP
ncbi:phosphoglycolate phosphatase [Roseateles puraquae]|uniref:phosphoglycolate phosphatase n=1 Tax=Roseateles puraquae TaxID=431059 RepID=UPI0031E1DFDC